MTEIDNKTMNISLPDPLKDFVESEESELTKQDFEDIRNEALAQLKRRKKKD